MSHSFDAAAVAASLLLIHLHEGPSELTRTLSCSAGMHRKELKLGPKSEALVKAGPKANLDAEIGLDSERGQNKHEKDNCSQTQTQRQTQN